MLVATGMLFTLGVALFLWDFFFLAPSKRHAGSCDRRATIAVAMTDVHDDCGRKAPRRAVAVADQHGGLRYPGAEAPYYLPVADEVAVFETCHARRLAIMLKGPPDAARRDSSSTWPGVSAVRS